MPYGKPRKRKASPEPVKSTKRPKEEWSLDDPVPNRKEIDLATLDLWDTKYVDKWVQPEPEQVKRPSKRRWRHEGAEPLTDKEKLPKGWSTKEDDLDPDDVDAQIQRCHERIDDNIMPHIFSARLENFLRMKETEEGMRKGEPEGLSPEVYVRIFTLASMVKNIEEEKETDQYEQIDNMKAILAAYRAGDLLWREGLVTYWSKGKCLCEPRPLDWDEFEAINVANDGSKSFWVEGVSGPGPIPMYASWAIPNDATKLSGAAGLGFSLNNYPLAIRLPGSNWWDAFEFIFDTGCTQMSLNQSDLVSLGGPTGVPPQVRVIMRAPVNTPAGVVNKDAILVEACVLDENNNRVTAWHRVPTIVNTIVGVPRLDGPIGRYALYSAMQPDGQGELYLSTTKTITQLQTINLKDNPPTIPIPWGKYTLNNTLPFYNYGAGNTGGGAPAAGKFALTVDPARANRVP